MKHADIATQLPEEAILEAAADVFAQHGFSGARVEAIARAAGINKAMLYYRLGDKSRLYELVILRHFERVALAVEQGASVPGGPGDKLAGILAALAELFVRDARPPRIMAWELASGGGGMPAGVTAMWGRIFAVVAPLAAKAGMDPLLTHLSMVGPLVFTCLTAPLRERLGAEMPAIASYLAGIGPREMAAFLGGLYRKAAGEEP
jgi:AcrR family transcriptional regulator